MGQLRQVFLDFNKLLDEEAASTQQTDTARSKESGRSMATTVQYTDASPSAVCLTNGEEDLDAELLRIAAQTEAAPPSSRGQACVAEQARKGSRPERRKQSKHKASKTTTSKRRKAVPKTSPKPGRKEQAMSTPQKATQTSPKQARNKQAMSTPQKATKPTTRPDVDSGNKMTLKCVRSRAYHAAVRNAKKEGLTDDDAKAKGREAAEQAAFEFAH